MSDQATDLVFNALRQMETNGAHPRATLASLARLQATAGSAPPADQLASAQAETPPRPKAAPPRETAPAPRLDATLLAAPSSTLRTSTPVIGRRT